METIYFNNSNDDYTFLTFLVKGFIRKGYALFALKELTKAKAAFDKALEIDPNNAVCLF